MFLDKKKAYDGSLISDNIQQLTTAAVDNPSMNLLGLLNITETLASMSAYFVSIGAPLKFAVGFPAMPAIRLITSKESDSDRATEISTNNAKKIKRYT